MPWTSQVAQPSSKALLPQHQLTSLVSREGRGTAQNDHPEVTQWHPIDLSPPLPGRVTTVIINPTQLASVLYFFPLFFFIVLNSELRYSSFCGIVQQNIQHPSWLAILKENLPVRQNTGHFLKWGLTKINNQTPFQNIIYFNSFKWFVFRVFSTIHVFYKTPSRGCSQNCIALAAVMESVREFS